MRVFGALFLKICRLKSVELDYNCVGNYLICVVILDKILDKILNKILNKLK